MSGGTGVANTSAGQLPNGMKYGDAVAVNNNGIMIVGGGYYYMMLANGLTKMPSDDEIETLENNVGVTQKGFTINYKPKIEQVTDQFGDIVENFLIREDVSIKTGIVTWNQKNLSALSAAVTYNTNSDTRTVFTGTTQRLPKVLVRFLKPLPDGGAVRFTMIGQGGKGFELAFGDKPVTVDAELESIKQFNNFIAELRTTPGISQESLQESNEAVSLPQAPIQELKAENQALQLNVAQQELEREEVQNV